MSRKDSEKASPPGGSTSGGEPVLRLKSARRRVRMRHWIHVGDIGFIHVGDIGFMLALSQ